jgi:hypothetical protein
LNWPTTDVNTTDRSEDSFLARVRFVVEECSNKVALIDNPDQILDTTWFLLQQWREIEKMVMKKGARGTGIATLE